MRRDELEFVALSPTTFGRAFVAYPQVFDLDDPRGYFQTVVEQRLQEKAQRALWDAAHARQSGKRGLNWKTEPSTTAGGESTDGKTGTPKKTEKGNQSGGAKKTPGNQSGGAEIRNLYPAGRALLAEEVAKSRELAPTDSKGR
eukprot:2976104-Amphidinium_carterae.1